MLQNNFEDIKQEYNNQNINEVKPNNGFMSIEEELEYLRSEVRKKQESKIDTGEVFERDSLIKEIS